MFEILAFGLVDYFVEKAKLKSKPFGFGGITKLNSGKLNSNLILSENVRLQSAMVILSREIQELINHPEIFRNEISLLRNEYNILSEYSSMELMMNKKKLISNIKQIIK